MIGTETDCSDTFHTMILYNELDSCLVLTYTSIKTFLLYARRVFPILYGKPAWKWIVRSLDPDMFENLA